MRINPPQIKENYDYIVCASITGLRFLVEQIVREKYF